MKKSRTVIRRRQSESPALRHLPLVDILVDAQAELQELVVQSGLKVLEAMLEEDRVAVCGPRYAHLPERRASRAGHAPSEVVLGGRMVALRPSLLPGMVRDPQKELTELNKRKAELEDSLSKREAELKELRSKKTLLERQIRRAQVCINAKERKRDTRQKILAGACVLDRAAKDPDSARHLKEILDAFLERDRDRALFDLPPTKTAP